MFENVERLFTDAKWSGVRASPGEVVATRKSDGKPMKIKYENETGIMTCSTAGSELIMSLFPNLDTIRASGEGFEWADRIGDRIADGAEPLASLKRLRQHILEACK